MSSNLASFDGMIRVLNTESEDIPAHSIAKVKNVSQYEHDTDSKNRSYLQVEKPNNSTGIYVCVPKRVESSKYGWAHSLALPRWLSCTIEDDEYPEPGSIWGPVNNSWKLSKSGSGIYVWGREQNRLDDKAVLYGSLQQSCLLVHELYIDGNPTTGSHSYDYTVDGSTDTLVFNYDDDATDIKSAFTSSSLGLSTTDLTVVGGPFPNVAAYVTFARDLTKKVSWPPVQNTVTLNNSAALKLRKSGG